MQGAQWPLVPGGAGQLGPGLRPAQLLWRLYPHHRCDGLDPAGADLRRCPPVELGPTTSQTLRAQGTHQAGEQVSGAEQPCWGRSWHPSPSLLLDITPVRARGGGGPSASGQDGGLRMVTTPSWWVCIQRVTFWFSPCPSSTADFGENSSAARMHCQSQQECGSPPPRPQCRGCTEAPSPESRLQPVKPPA